MTTGIWILIVILALVAGIAIGIYIARRTMDSYFEKNSPISEDMIRQMMASMGQKPSEKRVRQIMNSMKASHKK
ncbi:MAG: YneF family protein [Aerococcus sanguinicola]